MRKPWCRGRKPAQAMQLAEPRCGLGLTVGPVLLPASHAAVQTWSQIVRAMRGFPWTVGPALEFRITFPSCQLFRGGAQHGMRRKLLPGLFLGAVPTLLNLCLFLSFHVIKKCRYAALCCGAPVPRVSLTSDLLSVRSW